MTNQKSKEEKYFNNLQALIKMFTFKLKIYGRMIHNQGMGQKWIIHNVNFNSK